MTQANKYVSSIIQSLQEDIMIEDSAIKELIQYHPTKQLNDVEWLKLKTRPPFNHLSLTYKKNGKEDDISCKLCIRNLYGKYSADEEHEKKIKQAFRFEIHRGTKSQFYNQKTKCCIGLCDECKISTRDITVDHYPTPYKKIFETFLHENNFKLPKVEVFLNDINEYIIKDKDLAQKWLVAHDNQATYRLLCKSCNSRNGSYGY
jgi:hypothetical protein